MSKNRKVKKVRSAEIGNFQEVDCVEKKDKKKASERWQQIRKVASEVHSESYTSSPHSLSTLNSPIESRYSFHDNCIIALFENIKNAQLEQVKTYINKFGIEIAHPQTNQTPLLAVVQELKKTYESELIDYQKSAKLNNILDFLLQKNARVKLMDQTNIHQIIDTAEYSASPFMQPIYFKLAQHMLSQETLPKNND